MKKFVIALVVVVVSIVAFRTWISRDTESQNVIFKKGAIYSYALLKTDSLGNTIDSLTCDLHVTGKESKDSGLTLSIGADHTNGYWIVKKSGQVVMDTLYCTLTEEGGEYTISFPHISASYYRGTLDPSIDLEKAGTRKEFNRIAAGVMEPGSLSVDKIEKVHSRYHYQAEEKIKVRDSTYKVIPVHAKIESKYGVVQNNYYFSKNHGFVRALYLFPNHDKLLIELIKPTNP